MTAPALETFVSKAVARSREAASPADCVLALAPLMFDLIEHAGSFLQPRHLRSDPDSYARNLIYEAPDASLSLNSIVWLPGQWTPVHDHGSWASSACSRARSRSAATCGCRRTAAPTRTSSWSAAA